MTEYTTSSEAVREFLSARERTARWVGQHTGSLTGSTSYLSPSSPPSVLSDSDALISGPSDDDAGSSHSLPPRMVLRYGDGRDVPITADHAGPANPPWSRSIAPTTNPVMHPPTNLISHPPSSNHTLQYNRSRAGPQVEATYVPPSSAPPPRHVQSLSYATTLQSVTPQPHLGIPPSRSPESIMILPSRQDDEAQQSTNPPGTQPSHSTRQGPSQPNSQSHHHNATSSHPGLGRINTDVHQPGPIYGSSANGPHRPAMERDVLSPKPRRATDMSERSRLITRSPPIVHSQSQPTPLSGATRFYEHHALSARVQSQLPYAYAPPAIVYAPSSKNPKSNYHPPAIVYSPSPSHQTHTHSHSHSHASSSHGHHTLPRSHSRPPAPSITYSHSAPLPRQPPNLRQAVSRPYHSEHPSPTTPVVADSRFGSGRTGRSGRRAQNVRSRSPTPSLDDGSDSGSRTSGSTYYILPTPGQKVQVIVPNGNSIYASSKNGRSPTHHSPGSGSSGVRKPFFQRIFTMPKTPHILSLHRDHHNAADDAQTNKQLQRRHTVADPRAQRQQQSRR